MVKKRGQVTLFIIVGIVILFSAALLFYIRGEVEEKELGFEEEPKIAKVPTELLPVKEFVESCIEQVGKEGLASAGQHGGYVNIDDPLNGVVFVSGFGPTSSDYVEFVPGSEDKIPYWYYLKTPNADQSTSCEYSSKRPPLRKSETTLAGGTDASIERQLERYIDTELAACLRNFSPLAEQGFVVTPTVPVSKVTVANKDVRFLVTYPLTVDHAGSVTEVKEFYVKVPLELKRIYDLASEMVEYEQNYSEIEQRMSELISVFSDIDSSKLPPTSGMTFELAPSNFWMTHEVKENLELMFQAWVRAMQVYDTKNYDLMVVDTDLPYDDVVQQIYNNFVWGIEGYNDFEVRFDYLSWWPIYLDLNDKGGVFEPTSITGFLPIMGLQEYRASYDIAMPVYVEIKQPATPEFPNGYTFRIFLEGNMRNNQELDCARPPIVMQRYEGETLVCNANQRNSADVTITTVNAETREPVPEVVVSLSVGGRECSLGTTDGNGVLVTKFPVSYGAIVSYTKLGYLTQAMVENFDLETEKEFEIKMYKEQSVDVSIEKMLMERNGPVYVPTGEYSMLDETKTIDLVPGEYDLNMQIFSDREVNISSEVRCPEEICPLDFGAAVVGAAAGIGLTVLTGGGALPLILAGAGGFLGGGALAMGMDAQDETCHDECITVVDYEMPEVNLPSPIITGGAKYVWGVSSADLDRGKVCMRLIQFPEPEHIEELSQLSLVEEYSIAYKTLILPMFGVS